MRSQKNPMPPVVAIVAGLVAGASGTACLEK
jgi:hypothetical protein